MDGLELKAGRTPDRIDCPGPLVKEEGRSIRCTLVEGPVDLGITMTITTVDGGLMKYRLKVDSKPPSARDDRA